MSDYELETIVQTLGRHNQRASYGAVAELLGRPARSVMKGRSRQAEFSWW